MEEIGERIRPGLTGRIETVVGEEHMAKVSSDTRRRVFSTPSMISLMEQASVKAVDPLLPDGWLTVGTGVFVRHLAATPLGKPVRAESELIEVDRRKLVFRVEAYDDSQKIGEGTHERFIVNLDKFMGRSKGS